ncbi:MAG: SGNH/GDSL hydrolase family protein [Thermomicrobiales bacterium]|nr:SGNH/GDSL hydrolase family protein [Thermomicrobiales bacterium]
MGGNDARRIGPEPARTPAGITETAANLDALRRLAATRTEADEARIAAFPGFQQGLSTWRNADLVAIGDVIRSRPELKVDPQSCLGNPPDPELPGPDGLHPSLAGHQAIAQAVIERLTAREHVAPGAQAAIASARRPARDGCRFTHV